MLRLYIRGSTPPSYSSGPSTPSSYSSGPSPPPNYSPGSSRNADCSNCKHLHGKISVLKETIDMHMHPEQQGPTSCLPQKQQTVAQSSAEAEYVAAALATSQAICFCDSMSAIAIAKNPVHHSRTKYIALKHHFIKEAIEDGEVQLEFSGTSDQLADIFTKTLPREKFQELRRKLGVQPKHITGRP
ncbi:hypothetical protein Tco_1348349 [Tanacetum coccineum]